MPRRTQSQILLDEAHVYFTQPKFMTPEAQHVSQNSRRARNLTGRRAQRATVYEEQSMRAEVRRNKQRVYRKSRQGETFTISDPMPQTWLLSILKKYKGRRIRIVAYNKHDREIVRAVGDMNNEGGIFNESGIFLANSGGSHALNTVVERTLVDDVGNRLRDGPGNSCPDMLGDHTYSVPQGDNNAVNRYFKGKDGNRQVMYDWLFTYPWVSGGSPEPLLHPGDIVRVYTAEAVVAKAGPIQYFAQGVSHCLISPIVNDLSSKLAEAKTKQSKSNYKCAIDVLSGYEQKYRAGIPVSALHTMVEEVSMKHKINVEIKTPCAKRGEEQFIRVSNQYSHGKVYDFVNWRLHHVDELASTYKDYKNPVEISRDNLRSKIAELAANDAFFEWTTDSIGPVSLCTSDTTYRCHVAFGERYSEFCEKFNGYRIDHIQDNLMSKFVLGSVHYCCTAVCHSVKDRQNIKCFDISKSYAKSNDSRFYKECQFPGKLTDLYPVDRVMGPGMYLITDIDWTKADAKFVGICRLMGNPIQNNNVYVLPILKCLDAFHVTYKITMGCWAGGTQNKIDIEFTDDLIESKEYAVIVGKWNHLKHENITCLKGTKEFAQHLKSTSDNCDTYFMEKTDADLWEGKDGTIQVRYPNQHVWHLSQFTAYINGYEFTKMVDQLMEVELEKVIQIQKDDFMCEDHEFDLLPYMRDKSSELYMANEENITKLDRKLTSVSVDECDVVGDLGFCCYLSGVDDEMNPVFEKVRNEAEIHRARFAHIAIEQILNKSCMSFGGPGGTGKTDFLLRNKLLQRKVYIAQSHKLSRAKASEYKLVFTGDNTLAEIEEELVGRKVKTVRNDFTLQVTVWARSMHESPEIWGLIHRYANVIVFDEVSMMHTETARFLMERFKEHKIYFCGDPGYQIAAYRRSNDDAKSVTPFSAELLQIPTYTFTKIFRVTCDRQMQIRLEGRKLLEKGTTNMSHAEYRQLHCNDQFPSNWGEHAHKRPGPVAGMTFEQAEEVDWYCKKVAMSATKGLMAKFRRYIDPEFHKAQPIMISEIEDFYMDKYRENEVTTFEQVADMYEPYECVDGEYKPKDMIITSTNEFADQWTEYLKCRQPTVRTSNTVMQKQGKLFKYFQGDIEERAFLHRRHNKAHAIYLNAPDEKKADAYKQLKHYERLVEKMKPESVSPTIVEKEVVLQKWKVDATTRDYSNGEIVISETPPTSGSIIKHAFTCHSTIGETARGKVFIDRRNMFEIEHWETAIGRARKFADIVIINMPDPDVTEKYAKTKIYSISSKKGNVCYIGHTTQSLDKRRDGHVRDYKETNKKNRCVSRYVMRYKDWQMDLIEEYPCSSVYQARAREDYHIKQNPNAVNISAPLQDKLENCAPKKRTLTKDVDIDTESTNDRKLEDEVTTSRNKESTSTRVKDNRFKSRIDYIRWLFSSEDPTFVPQSKDELKKLEVTVSMSEPKVSEVRTYIAKYNDTKDKDSRRTIPQTSILGDLDFVCSYDLAPGGFSYLL